MYWFNRTALMVPIESFGQDLRNCVSTGAFFQFITVAKVIEAKSVCIIYTSCTLALTCTAGAKNQGNPLVVKRILSMQGN